jgi:RNA recognition motif-containing protein
MSIYVGNLSYEVTEADLSTVFAEYGSVKRVHVPTDRESGKVRGFAFVEMDSADQEEAAITQLDGAEWMGRTMKVNKARERENRGHASGNGRGQQRRNRF